MIKFLRERGSLGLEAFSLWAGTADGEVFNVRVNIVPAQAGHVSAQGVSVYVGPDELHRLNIWLYEKKMSLIAQIHTHPSEAYHSELDDAYPIATTTGCISIVIPDFARHSFSAGRCAVYRLNALRQWALLDISDTLSLINVVY
jgi:hypothetical protein